MNHQRTRSPCPTADPPLPEDLTRHHVHCRAQSPLVSSFEASRGFAAEEPGPALDQRCHLCAGHEWDPRDALAIGGRYHRPVVSLVAGALFRGNARIAQPEPLAIEIGEEDRPL